jgi:WD40 repeat protein
MLHLFKHSESAGIFSVAMHRDIVVSGSDEPTIKMWNLTTGTLIQTIAVHSSDVMGLCIADDIFVSGSYDNTVRVWDRYSGQLLRTYSGPRFRAVALFDGVVVTGSDDGKVRLWSRPPGALLRNLNTGITVKQFDQMSVHVGAREKLRPYFDQTFLFGTPEVVF